MLFPAEEDIITGAKPKALKDTGLVIDRSHSLSHFISLLSSLPLSPTQDLSSHSVRWSAWRFMLGLSLGQPQGQPITHYQQIITSIQNNRDNYRSLFQRHSQKDIQKPQVIDPLSAVQKDSSHNPWNNYFEDADIRKQIKIDIERTFQEKEFFRHLSIKRILNNILFTWAKENPVICYKQGMNELAAIVTFVAFSESIISTDEVCLACSDSQENEQQRSLYVFMNEQEHAEADIYWALDRLLQSGHLEMFRTGNENKGKKNINQQGLQHIFSFYYKNPLDRNVTCGVMRVKRIFETYLYHLDPILCKHLKNHGVEPQIFLLRWVRCIFQREFHLEDMLQLWDAILHNHYRHDQNEPFLLIDAISVAMIVFLKDQILSTTDSTRVFQRLMKYPPVESVKPILNMAYQYQPIIKELEEKELSIQQKANNKKQEQFISFSNQQVNNSEQKTQTNKIQPIETTQVTQVKQEVQQKQQDQQEEKKEKKENKEMVSKQNKVKKVDIFKIDNEDNETNFNQQQQKQASEIKNVQNVQKDNIQQNQKDQIYNKKNDQKNIVKNKYQDLSLKDTNKSLQARLSDIQKQIQDKIKQKREQQENIDDLQQIEEELQQCLQIAQVQEIKVIEQQSVNNQQVLNPTQRKQGKPILFL